MAQGWLWLMATPRGGELLTYTGEFRRIPDPYDWVSSDPLYHSLRVTGANLLIGMAHPEYLSVAMIRQRRFLGDIWGATNFIANPPEPLPDPIPESFPELNITSKFTGIPNDSKASEPVVIPGTLRRIVVFDSRQPWDERLSDPRLCGRRLSPSEVVAALPIGKTTKNRWYPIIDRTRCSECGDCVTFCPFKVYELDNGVPKVTHPDECRTDCVACTRICPPQAIFLPYSTEPEVNGETAMVLERGPDGQPIVPEERRRQAESERALQARNRTRPTPVPSKETQEETVSRWMDQLDELEADEP